MPPDIIQSLSSIHLTGYWKTRIRPSGAVFQQPAKRSVGHAAGRSSLASL